MPILIDAKMRRVIPRLTMILTFVVAMLAMSPSVTSAAEPVAVDFNRDIRTILSDKCFQCHGPDEDKREAGLRLDLRDQAIESGAIEPGHADDSELVARITADDPDLVMPPPSTRNNVSAAEAELIKRWIDADARYEVHWAFTPPRYADLPEVNDRAWIQNPIDRFVLAQLEQRGLRPSPPADPVTIARRLYLDLIGLPPSPPQADQFVASPVAETLVDSLLRSPHFGERWGRWWLDAARYADSDGYEKDKPRSVWFYRDWVINAMNHDLPYDEFVVQQIAGDLLPGANQDSRVATGFLRCSMVNEEGGADPEQFRVEAMFDRMDAIGKAILGITTQCAQCHTHKFDPLSQHEYYEMFASLNDFHEASMSVFTSQQQAHRAEVIDGVAALETILKRRTPDWRERVATWAADRARSRIEWHTMVPTERPWEGQKFRLLEDGSIVSESYAPTKANDTFSLELTADKITAFRIDALTHPQLPRGGPGRSIYGTGALSEFEVTIAPVDEPDRKQVIEFERAIADVNPPRAELPSVFREKNAAEDDRVTGPVEYAIDGDKKTAWTTATDPGRRNRDRHAIFVPTEPITATGKLLVSITLRQVHGGWNSDDNQNYLIGRYRFSFTDAEEIPATTVPSTVEQILETNPDDRSAEQWAELFSYWRTTVPEFAETNQQIEQLWETYPETDSQLVVIAKQQPRKSFVFSRGDFLNPQDEVQPDVPEFLNQMPKSDEPARLRFARWLVADDSPTTARVIVNRIWQSYFGRGLVETPEDFGFQSSPPSHPALLDWLALELMDHDWSLKHIHRLITTSATYQQSSQIEPSLLEQDPANQWLARGPRFRVDAEVVRDIALTASGLLDDQVGGPSVYPPAPDFLFEPPASYGPKVWDTSTGGEQYRRSLYVHRFRSVPYPPLLMFDAPKGDAACIRRLRSNTPLQALVVLNEPQFVASARAMAARVLREVGPSDDERIRYAHQLCVSREPTESELNVLRDVLAQQRQRIEAAEVDVAGLAGATPSVYRQLTGNDPHELAAWMVVCRVLLNLDETITKS